MQLGNLDGCDFLKKLIFILKNSSSGPEPIGYCPSILTLLANSVGLHGLLTWKTWKPTGI